MSEQIEGAQDWIRKAINQLKNYQQYYERMCLCHNMKIDPLMKEATEAFIRRAPVVAPNVMRSDDQDAASDALILLKAVLGCETKHDENGHAYLKVPARSIFDLGAEISRFVKRAATKDGIAT